MTCAIVLIEADRDAMSTLGSTLAEMDGVAEAYSVTGEWDFAVVVRVRAHDDLARVVQEGILRLDGVQRTSTMVAFETYSKHDLEAMFSLGG